MGSMSNTLETDNALLYFNNTNAANIGDATGLRGSTTAGSLYVSLHTASPGEAGSQTTSEVAYTNYARVAVARSGAGFTVSGNTTTNAADVSFPACGVTGATATHFGIGRSSSGAGTLDYYGPLTPARFGMSYDIADAATDVLLVPGHNFVATSGLNQIAFEAVNGQTLPTGITEGTVYFVKTVATDVISISATDGGSTLNITASGSGFAMNVVPLAIANGITPKFSTGQLSVKFD